ncbi:DEAD-box ATP-dependent RNA helicase 22-like [Salvia divinorum]|uniref:RNA helicase n=1 Tax=Salvia divinorum TaxID=28513 RepID=A0ABD1H3C7_SALDI
MLLQRSISVLNTCRISLHSPRIFSFSASNLSLLSLPPAYFSSPSSYRQLKAHKLRGFTTNAADENGSAADTFLAEEGVSWTSLGVADSISRALSNVGLPRPSLVQAACVPAILSGDDVVVAAETGSGKTHGYLVPIIHKVYSNSDALHDPKLKKHQHVSLVLCPNVMLCEQVVRMANSLLDGAGEPLLKAAAVCGRQGLIVKDPDIIVSTPVALLNYLYAIDPERRKRTDFIRGVKYVVFDEADLLLCGSFQNQVIRLINMLRFDEKQLSRFKDADAGVQDPLSVPVDASDTEEDFPEDFDLEEAADGDEKSIDEPTTEPRKRTWKDWMRVRKIYARSKQYIFVAATLPLNGKRTAGGTLKRMFPDANWVNGSYLHHHNPRLEQKWIEVTVDTQVDVLINAVKNGYKTNADSAAGVVWTMVFANTVEAAEAVANILVGAGIRCLRYHRDISLEERTDNLVDFQQNGGVFVCTDAAARGLDVPNVSHVIQAEFASSAVDFLHRVGRTARAGQPGLVTSLYAESNRELVASVRQAGELSMPVEKAFSRKRSFRKKLKKRGRDGASSASRPIAA